MVYHVESLGEVNRHGDSLVRGEFLVETPGYFLCKREESSGCGVALSEAMLGES